MACLNTRSIDELRPLLRGPLLVPGDSEYETSRTVWNAMIDRRPALVVRCLGVADITACLRFAGEYGLPLSIKGGGHNVAGVATCDEGLMLDMSLMRGVWVDPRARTARAQAGCLLGDVDRETQVHGLATPLGFVSNTGIAGLTATCCSVAPTFRSRVCSMPRSRRGGATLAFFHFGPQQTLPIGEGDTNFHWAKSCQLHNWRNSLGVGIRITPTRTGKNGRQSRPSRYSALLVWKAIFGSSILQPSATKTFAIVKKGRVGMSAVRSLR